METMKFKQCHYFASACLSRQLNKIAEKAFQDLHLAPSYAYILTCVADEPGIDCKRLCDLMLLAPSSLTRMVDKLVALGYITRQPQGRCTIHHITPEGELLMPKIKEAWRIQGEVFARVFDDELSERLSTAMNDAIISLKNK